MSNDKLILENQALIMRALVTLLTDPVLTKQLKEKVQFTELRLKAIL